MAEGAKLGRESHIFMTEIISIDCCRSKSEDQMDVLTRRVKTVFDIEKVLYRFSAAANLLVNYVPQPGVLLRFR